MKKTTFYFLAILIMLCGVSASCDKTQPTSEKRVKTMIVRYLDDSTQYISFDFTYDEQNRIVSVVSDDETATFVYSANSVLCKTLSSRSKITETGSLNEQGQIIKAQSERTTMSQGMESTSFFWYNISGSVDSTKVNYLSSGGNLLTDNTSYEWYNGDLIHRDYESKGSESIAYFTYTTTENKANVLAYYLFCQNSVFYFAAPLMKAYQTKHLIKTIVHRNKITTFSRNFKYTFDSDGYVTSLDDGDYLYLFRYE